jgi:hypothetical protein
MSTTFIVRDDSDTRPLAELADLTIAGRTELKYCAPASVSERILDLARVHLVPDIMALGARQRVTSLYLDTDQLTFLRWHRERAADRFKLRIRRYGEQPSSTLYAELKRKTGSIVRKRRGAFHAQALCTVLNGLDLSAVAASPEDTENLHEFGLRRRQCGATPRMLVTCVRESLRDPHDGTAVTVDRDLRFQPTRSADLEGNTDSWRPMPLFNDSAALVELKFSLPKPVWMEALIAQLAPWRVSFSKYAAAMNDCRAAC